MRMMGICEVRGEARDQSRKEAEGWEEGWLVCASQRMRSMSVMRTGKGVGEGVGGGCGGGEME